MKFVIPRNQRSELANVVDGDIYLFRYNKRGIISSIFFLFCLLKSVCVYKPDVVHLHSSFAGAIGRLVLLPFFLSKRVRIVYCPHAFSFLMSTSEWRKSLYFRMEKLLLSFSDKVICVSNHEMVEAVARGMPSRKLTVIRNGIRPPRSIPSRDFSSDGIRALFVGRFDRQKGFDTLLDAMALLVDSPVKLVAIGGSVLEKEKKRELPNVEYLGWLDQAAVTRYYSCVDVLVMPSRWEGFAMVPLEAMSWGLPVIGSNIPPLAELISNNENGLLFETNSSADIVRILSNIRVESLQTYSVNARRTVLENFNYQLMAAKTFELYSEVVCSAREL